MWRLDVTDTTRSTGFAKPLRETPNRLACADSVFELRQAEALLQQ
jgi:hypothetical protein